MWQKQDDVLSTRHQGTGQWLLENSAFLQWLYKDSGQQILWCPGAREYNFLGVGAAATNIVEQPERGRL